MLRCMIQHTKSLQLEQGMRGHVLAHTTASQHSSSASVAATALSCPGKQQNYLLKDAL